MLGNIIVFLIIAAMVFAAISKIIIDKRNGVRCSGCPHSKTCSVISPCSSQPLSGYPVNSDNIEDLRTNQRGD